MVTITIINSIISQRPLNVIACIFIFVLLLFFINQWNLTHQIYGLYFGNNIVINSGNVSSSFTKGQMSTVERGYAYVVWVDKNNTIYFSASHDNGTKFSSPIALSSNNNSLAISPHIIATEKGGVYVVWVDKNNATGDSNIVFRGSNDSGKSFDSSVRLNRNVSPNQTSVASYPQIDATEKGGVYVVWVDKNNATGDSNIVFRGSNDSGKSFDSSVRLNRNVSPNQTSVASYPQIDATEKGGVYVVWVDKKENGDTNIAFITSNNSGKDFTNRKYIRSNDLLSFSPQIDATEKGGVYVVWVDKNNATGDSNIVFRGSNDSGKSFDRSVRLNRNVSPNQTSVASYPQIDATEKGGVYVVWVDKNNATGDSNIVFRGSNDSGKSFDSSVRLNRNPNQISISFAPQIAANEIGSVFVTWPENTLQFKEILDGGNIFGRTVSLNNHVVLPLSAQVVAAENGNIYLAWAEKNNGLNNDTVLMFKRIGQYYFDRR